MDAEKSKKILDRVWSGKFSPDQLPIFSPIGQKTAGYSVGALYLKSRTNPDKSPTSSVEKPWLGKVGFTGLSPELGYSHEELAQHLSINSVKEKIYTDIYSLASVMTSKARLSEQPLSNEYTLSSPSLYRMLDVFTPALTKKYEEMQSSPPGSRSSSSTKLNIANEEKVSLKLSSLTININHTDSKLENYIETEKEKLITSHATFLMSKMIADYRDLGDNSIKTDSDGNILSIPDYILRQKQLPDNVTIDDETLPLKGAYRALAIAKFLLDQDALGTKGTNAGIVVKTDADGTRIAHFVKIDTGESMKSSDYFIGTKIKVGGGEGSNHFCIDYDGMNQAQKYEFLEGLRFMQNLTREDFTTLVSREGQFDRVFPRNDQDELITRLLERQEEITLTYGEDLAILPKQTSEHAKANTAATTPHTNRGENDRWGKKIQAERTQPAVASHNFI